MDSIRLVNACLTLFFEEGVYKEEQRFTHEYEELSVLNDDALGAWLKSSKTRKEVQESDPVLLALIIELHRKVDMLTRMVEQKEQPLHLPLRGKATIHAVGYDGYFECDVPVLQTERSYYGRFTLPSFPKRVTPLFFQALSPTLAKITTMHHEDEREWDTYVASCERAMIREMKGFDDEY